MSTMTTDSSLLELVDLASHSPSGHNAQPWTVVRTGEHRLVLRSERDRWLTQVDPSNRELLLSFGALMETIRQAAPSTGYRADLHVVADRADTPEIAQVDLTPAPAVASTAPSLIRSRATTRTPFTPDEVPSKDVDSIVGLDRAALAFVPRQSSNGRWLADAATEAFANRRGMTASRRSWPDGFASLGRMPERSATD